ncbi:hypothetical protein, partial [Corynebacterium casei]|uniref:hypothetical protein n=2 Tax=Corynebacterium casei TaxID=160386 RepID=UPI002649C785
RKAPLIQFSGAFLYVFSSSIIKHGFFRLMIRFGVCIRESLPIKPILKVEQLFPRATNLSLLLTLKLLRQEMILGGFLPAFQRICKSRTGSMEKRTPRHERSSIVT